jgi:hypothetical protein
VNGAVLETHRLDASVLWTDEVQVVGSHSSAPLVIWNEKGKIKVNVLGSKSISTLTSEVPLPPTKDVLNSSTSLIPFTLWHRAQVPR